MSSGEIVPDVMTTLLKRSKTGAIPSDGSRQLHNGAKKSAKKEQAEWRRRT